MKTCRACNTEKPLSEFHRESRTSDGRRGSCKSCMNAIRMSRYYDNPSKSKACNKRRNLIRAAAKQGISENLLVVISREREKSCWICKGKKPEKTLHMDHDHKTGKFRGLICYNCNLAIGYLKDDPDLLRRVAAYLEDPPGVSRLENLT